MSAALLAAVIATPDDDLVRLVYADWLEENGDPDRAELIRVQCELAKLPDWDGRCIPLKHRERVLLARHGRRWHAELPPVEGVSWGAYHRGFVRSVTVTDVKALTANAEGVAALTPLDAITLGTWPTRNFRATPLPWLKRMNFTQRYEFQAQHLERVLESPLAAHLTALDLSGVGVENAGAAVVSRMRHLKALASLDFSNGFVGVAGATALAAADHLKSLTRLEFSSYGSGYVDDPFVSEAGVEAIAASPRFRNLTHLGLGGNGVTTQSIQRLLGSKTLANLKSVVLAQGERIEAAAFAATDGPARWADLNVSMWWEADNGILAAVARSPQLAGLVRLKMASTPANAEGVRALAGSTSAATLRELDLSSNSLPADTVCGLTDGRWPELHTLRLGGNEIGAEGCNRLAASKGFPALAVLDLGACEIGDDGAKAIAKAAWAKTLRRVELNTNDIGREGATALAASKHLRGLTKLELYDNPLTDDGARAVCSADLPHLTDLGLGHTGNSGDTIAKSLSESGRLGTLLTLKLTKTELTSAGLVVLTEQDAPALSLLELSDNKLTDAAGEALAAADWPALRTLHMSSCGVGADGMAALALSPLFDRLVRYHIYGNTTPTRGPAAKKFQRNTNYMVKADPTQLDEGDTGDEYY